MENVLQGFFREWFRVQPSELRFVNPNEDQLIRLYFAAEIGIYTDNSSSQLMSYSTETPVQETQKIKCKIFIYITDTWVKKTSKMKTGREILCEFFRSTNTLGSLVRHPWMLMRPTLNYDRWIYWLYIWAFWQWYSLRRGEKG